MNVMPVVDLGRQPAKATVGEPFPVRATVFREGHDKLGAEVVLTGPDGNRRPPVRMTKHPEIPDRYDAWVTPDVGGSWTFEVQAWSDPVGTWQHNAGIKIPAGVDVELMFTEARLLLERVLAELPPDDSALRRDPARRRPRGRRHRASGGGAARGAPGPRPHRGAARAPAAGADHRRGPLPRLRGPASSRSSAAGTSSSRARREPRRTRRPARSSAATSAPPRSASTPWPRWAST